MKLQRSNWYLVWSESNLYSSSFHSLEATFHFIYPTLCYHKYGFHHKHEYQLTPQTIENVFLLVDFFLKRIKLANIHFPTHLEDKRKPSTTAMTKSPAPPHCTSKQRRRAGLKRHTTTFSFFFITIIIKSLGVKLEKQNLKIQFCSQQAKSFTQI